MKSDHLFVAERSAAQHCAELLRKPRPQSDLLADLRHAGDRAARALAEPISSLAGVGQASVALDDAWLCPAGALLEGVGALAANALLHSPAGACEFLLTVDAAAMLNLVDRAFGGSGSSTPIVPQRFSPSARLMIERVEAIVTTAIGEAFGLTDLMVNRRGDRIAEFETFAPTTDLGCLRLTISSEAGAPWHLLIAAPSEHLQGFVGTSSATSKTARRSPVDPAEAPFADVPMVLTATLVDMPMSLAALDSLEPGAILPVAIARAVPVSIAGTTLARGTVGSAEDRIAIKLTQIA